MLNPLRSKFKQTFLVITSSLVPFFWLFIRPIKINYSFNALNACWRWKCASILNRKKINWIENWSINSSCSFVKERHYLADLFKWFSFKRDFQHFIVLGIITYISYHIYTLISHLIMLTQVLSHYFPPPLWALSGFHF